MLQLMSEDGDVRTVLCASKKVTSVEVFGTTTESMASMSVGANDAAAVTVYGPGGASVNVRLESMGLMFRLWAQAVRNGCRSKSRTVVGWISISRTRPARVPRCRSIPIPQKSGHPAANPASLQVPMMKVRTWRR